MKITIISDKYPPNISGGGEISARLLAETLKENGLDVEVISYDGNGSDILYHNGIKINRFPGHKRSCLAKLIFMLKNTRDTDIVHFYGLKHAESGWIIRLINGCRTVVTLNNYPYAPDQSMLPAHKYIYRSIRETAKLFFIKQSDMFICISSTLKSEYVNLGFDKEKCNVIPNMISPDQISSDKASKKRRSGQKKGFGILFIGMLYPHKGVDILIRAVSELTRKDSVKKKKDKKQKTAKKKMIKDIRLDIIGSGPQEEDLKRLADDLRISNKVEFHGWIPPERLNSFHDEASVFVHPGTWKEPFGRTILESMARGLPPIVSDVGAPPELVKEKKLIFRSGDAASLADRLRWAASNKKALKKISENLLRRSESYTTEKVIKRFLDAYSVLVKQ